MNTLSRRGFLAASAAALGAAQMPHIAFAQGMAPISLSAATRTLDIDGRAALPCIGFERADLVVAGCAILEAILDIWPAVDLGIADRGIREGILRSLMARDGYRL